MTHIGGLGVGVATGIGGVVQLRFILPFCGFTLYYGLWANGYLVCRY